MAGKTPRAALAGRVGFETGPPVSCPRIPAGHVRLDGPRSSDSHLSRGPEASWDMSETPTDVRGKRVGGKSDEAGLRESAVEQVQAAWLTVIADGEADVPRRSTHRCSAKKEEL
jgi:hypothetical protein